MTMVTEAPMSARPNDTDLFAGCRPKELAAISRLYTEMAVAPRRVLLREGEPSGQFLVITAGSAQVEMGSKPIGIVSAGSFVGELSLIDGGACIATVTAITPMHLLVFGPSEFEALMNLEIRSVMRRMLHTVARRLRATDALHGS